MDLSMISWQKQLYEMLLTFHGSKTRALPCPKKISRLAKITIATREVDDSLDARKLFCPLYTSCQYDMASFIMETSMKHFCWLSVIFILFCSSLRADVPLLSSHAMSLAMKAKDDISSHDEKAILSAVINLEELLRHPSFRRLEIQAQVQILFLLSKGYERLNQYQKQEKLLADYAARREFFRFHVPLIAALVRTYILQDRIQEAEVLLTKLVKPSCAHLSLEEKGEIATIVAWKDDHISQTIRQADRLFVTGDWEHASSLYRKVCASIEHLQFPYQSSPVEKKKLHQKIIFRMGEAAFLLGNYEEALSFLSPWDDLLFEKGSHEPLCTRRLFLMALAHQKLHNLSAAQSLFQAYRRSSLQKIPVLDHEAEEVTLTSMSPIILSMTMPTPQLLWHAQEAIRLNTQIPLQRIIEEARQRKDVPAELMYILEGHLYAIQGNLVAATEKMIQGAFPSNGINTEWRQSAVTRLAQICWQRAVLLVSSEQQAQGECLAKRILQLTENEKDALLVASERTLFQLLIAKIHGTVLKQAACTNDGSSITDQLFQRWVNDTTVVPTFEHDEFDSNPVTIYAHLLTLFVQTMSDEIPYEEAMSSIQEALANDNLIEVRPQLLQWLIEIALHYNQYSTAYEVLTELMNNHPSYQSLPQPILACIIAFESTTDFDNERFILCQYLLNRPTDIFSLFLTVHLFQCKRWIASEEGTPLASVEKALLLHEEGKGAILDAAKSKEPGLIKNRIELTKNAFDVFRTHIKNACSYISDHECQSFLYSLLFSFHQELLELLERSIVSEYAFNELPLLLEQTSSTLRQDLESFSMLVPHATQFLSPPFLLSCSQQAAVAELYCLTFSRELNKAFAKYHELSQTPSPSFIRASLFLSKTLRESHQSEQAYNLIAPFQQEEICDKDHELALEIAIEKSLCLRELQKPAQAKALLAWIINSPYASSLRVKAMILRAEIYLSLHRTDLAFRQLESVVAKGGEWAPVAERKLQELYGTN